MATSFVISLDELFFRKYLGQMLLLKEKEPDMEFFVHVCIGLVPDGVGYEALDPKVEMVGRTKVIKLDK